MADYYRFNLFNVISFSFLAGNIIVLYALRLGAGNVLVGLIAASYQVTFVFSLLGRRIVRRFGAVRVFGYFWLLRYMLMLPVLLTALPGIRERTGLVLAIVTVCAFAFNISKGIGITATKPIVGEIPPARERGMFISSQHLITNLGAVVTGTIMALALGQDAPLGRYAILLTVGIFAGFFAAYFILRLPEPEEAGAGFTGRFTDGLAEAFKPGPFRILNTCNILLVFAVSMSSAFLIVFFKRVYGYPDGTVVFFTVAGSAGGAAMAVVTRAVLDRVGAKPLLFVFAGLMLLVQIPLAMSPDLSGVWLWLFPALVYFFFMMARFGIMNTADNYFFSATAAEQRLDLGIIFGLGTGIAGSLGSFLGGVVLSSLEQLLPGSPVRAFTAFHLVIIALLVVPVFRLWALPDLDSYPIPDALGMLVTPRDIRAIRLLNRLRRSRTVEEEAAAVTALGENKSRLPVDDLRQRLSSPSLTIRMETISALRNSPLSPEVETALIDAVRDQRYTTAHLAAELLGSAGVYRAIPALRDAVESHDYMVSAKSMLALAKLRDRDSIGRIEAILERSPNPRITIFAAKALEAFGSLSSLPLIFRRIDRRSELFVRDELILVASSLLGTYERFYPTYIEFLSDPAEGIRTLRDLAASAPAPVQAAVGALAADSGSAERAEFVRRAIAVFEKHAFTVSGKDVSPWFVDALRNRNVGRLDRFCVLVAAVMPAVTSYTPEHE
jgi:Na+/melibiose symporter-like transporter